MRATGRPKDQLTTATPHDLLSEDKPEEEPPTMTGDWSSEQLKRIGVAEELRIATKRADGTLRSWVPIWVVCVSEQVYGRTWYRRDSGWFGQALDSLRARIRVPNLEVDVAVEDVGEDGAELRAGIDAAYRTKYGRHSGASVERMVTDDAAASTLRLSREQGARASEDD